MAQPDRQKLNSKPKPKPKYKVTDNVAFVITSVRRYDRALLVDFVISSRARHHDKRINDGLSKVWRRLNYVGGIMSNFAYGKDIRLFRMKDFLLSRYGAVQNELADGHGKIQGVWLRAKMLLATTSTQSMLHRGLLVPHTSIVKPYCADDP